MSLESYLASFGVPVDDVVVELGLELLVRVEFAVAVELVLEMAEHLFGGGVVQAVALAAHRLADVQLPEPFAPPRVLVLPSHVRVQYGACTGGQLGREHGEQTLLLFHVGMPADVPGHDLLAGHVIDRREIGLGARDLELGDVGAELLERLAGPEVALEQVRHPSAGLAPVRAVLPPGARRPYPAPEPHAAHDPEHGLGRHPLPELADQTHVDLPVPASVGGPAPDRRDQRFEVGPRHMLRMRQVTVVRGPRQPAGPQQVVEPVSPPCERSHDGASPAPRDFRARRARTFSRYATFALR